MRLKCWMLPAVHFPDFSRRPGGAIAERPGSRTNRMRTSLAPLEPRTQSPPALARRCFTRLCPAACLRGDLAGCVSQGLEHGNRRGLESAGVSEELAVAF